MNEIPYTAETCIYLKDGVHRKLTRADLPSKESDFYNALTMFNTYRELTKCLIKQVDEDSLQDVIVFNNLPELVCLYRGANKEEATVGFGQSWSMSKKVAEFFAYKHYSSWSYKDIAYFANVNRCVFQAFVPREHIIMYYNGRQEFECILDPEYTVDSAIREV